MPYNGEDRTLEMMTRAENVVADFFPGGYLPPYRYNEFWRYVDDQPALIDRVRRMDMPSHTLEIPRFGMGEQILHGSNELTAMLPPQYSRFETGTVYMHSFKVMAEIQFTYEMLEDNIKKGAIVPYIMAEMRKKIRNNLELLILMGDKSINPAVNDLLCMEDGLIKRTRTQMPAGRPSEGKMGGHIVDAVGQPISIPIWYDLERAVPEKYLADDGYIYVTTRGVDLSWRETRTDRPTGVGDDHIFQQKRSRALGRDVLTTPFMPVDKATNTSYMFLINPQNIILGTYKDMKIETDRDIQKQKIRMVLSTRIGLTVEEPDAIGMVENLKAWLR